MKEQWQRQIMLLGEEKQESLHSMHVAVFGIGGVGSFAAEALARAGVGRLTLVDHDTVSVSNLNRQLIALHSTVGKFKVDVMAERIADINPGCKVTVIRSFYDAEHREAFFCEPYDYIADAIDSVPSKTDLIASAIGRGIPIISSMGTGNRLDPSKFKICDLSETSGCPLARVMRQRLPKLGIEHHTVLSSTEPPVSPIRDGSIPENVPGSAAWVPPCAGMMIAGFIVRALSE